MKYKFSFGYNFITQKSILFLKKICLWLEASVLVVHGAIQNNVNDRPYFNVYSHSPTLYDIYWVNTQSHKSNARKKYTHIYSELWRYPFHLQYCMLITLNEAQWIKRSWQIFCNNHFFKSNVRNVILLKKTKKLNSS